MTLFLPRHVKTVEVNSIGWEVSFKSPAMKKLAKWQAFCVPYRFGSDCNVENSAGTVANGTYDTAGNTATVEGLLPGMEYSCFVNTILTGVKICSPAVSIKTKPFNVTKISLFGMQDIHGQNYFSRNWGSTKNDTNGKRTEGECSDHYYNGQTLDHFNPRDTRTLSQRYTICQQYAGGDDFPIFLYIGGEGAVGEGNTLLDNTIGDLTKKFKGTFVALEHRYYGLSCPRTFPEASPETLSYLSSKQAIEDMKQFLDYLQNASPSVLDQYSDPALSLKWSLANSKIIVAGGSYPGNLAAWLKLSYNEFISGALSFSGPLLAQYDFTAYLEVVKKTYKNEDIGGSDECFKFWDDVFLWWATNIVNSPDNLPHELVSCYGANDATMAALLLNNIRQEGIFSQNYVDYLPSIALDGPRKYCPIAKELESSYSYEKAMRMGMLRLKQDFYPGTQCIPFSVDEEDQPIPADLNWPSASSDADKLSGYLWNYQFCNEFGYIQGGYDSYSGRSSGWAVDQFLKRASEVDYLSHIQCSKFGSKYIPEYIEQGIQNTNKHYLGRSINNNGITYINAGLDPWHVFSIVPQSASFFQFCPDELGNQYCTQQVSDSGRVLYAPLGSHCFGLLREYEEQLNPEVFSQYDQIIQQIHTNVAQYV